ncbi:MAG: peptidoglycan DD-metalloendopeptidase family protein, partial [Pseudomonadota bacterium]
SSVLRNRIKSVVRISSFGIAGVLVAGCSSGFERFDHYYRSATPQQQASNAYPGVDPTTTASTGTKLQPLSDVRPTAVPQGVYNHQPEPTYAAPVAQPTYSAPQPYQPAYQQQPVYQQPAYQQPVASAPVRQPLNTYRAPRATAESATTYSSARLPSAAPQKPAVISGPAYSPPAPSAPSNTVYIPQNTPDPVNTASVRTTPVAASTAPVTPANTAIAPARDGWTKAGGTTITVRQGETLYNLSKRYGVPVDAIRKANGMSSAASLQAGQRVLIPNYIFSPTSPVSAPDKDSGTRAARASTGFVGEADPRNVAIPTSRPYYASRAPAVATQPVVQYQPPAPEVTGTRGPVVSSSNTNPGVDPIVTSSVAAKAATAGNAPAATGISNFRWPVSGRVVTEFNAATASGKNEGIDISVPEGTAVKAAENGVVIYAGSEISSYGNLILIRHADDWVSAYAHNKAFAVKKGDKVNRGQIIARSGKTGDAERPKLHFELRKNSVPVNPKKYLSGA